MAENHKHKIILLHSVLGVHWGVTAAAEHAARRRTPSPVHLSFTNIPATDTSSPTSLFHKNTMLKEGKKEEI